MEINQYIKELLLLNDCVIIPEFGGFVANYKPASFENNQFTPPTKEIAFNNKLISNDGLLINYIADSEGISYFTARQKLENFVDETMLSLERNRNVYFEGVGYLHYDSRENLLFEPQIKENLLAESYGLQNFTYEKLYQRQMPRPAFKVEYKESVPVIFEKRKVKKLAIAIPLLMAMALIPMKNHKEYIAKSDMNIWEVLTQSAPSTPVQVKKQTTAQYTAHVPATQTIQYKYYIIGGSFRNDENAIKYIQQLKNEGYDGKDLGVFNGLHRIAMKGFSNLNDARKELHEMLAENPKSGYWIHVNE